MTIAQRITATLFAIAASLSLVALPAATGQGQAEAGTARSFLNATQVTSYVATAGSSYFRLVPNQTTGFVVKVKHPTDYNVYNPDSGACQNSRANYTVYMPRDYRQLWVRPGMNANCRGI